MYSIDFDKSIIKNISQLNIDSLFPHEKIISKKSSTLTNFLKSFDNYIIISSIVCCSKSKVIIDGHHRYFTLKKLGFNKIPVTQIDYFSEDISTGINEENIKHKIIADALNGNLLEPKSTSHKIFSHKSKTWEPIILLSSLSKIEIKNDQESQ